MNNQPKVQLSPLEMELVINSDWILTKNEIIEKVKLLLAGLQQRQEALLSQFPSALPEEVIQPSSKISKGENYKGLPYLVLDYPRFFNKDHIFAIRSFFWWGNFFSTTLHLSGEYKERYEARIIEAFPDLQEAGYYVCINEDPWEHNFSEINYTDIKSLTADGFKELIYSHSFIKLSKKITLREWDGAEEKLLEMFRLYVSLCWVYT